MVEFKLTINDPKTGKSYQKTISGDETSEFRGKKLGDKISGTKLGLEGYELEITGGSDKQGFPMRKDLEGQGRTKPLVVSGIGAKAKRDGERQRKTVRGNALSTEVSQINIKVTKQGKDSLDKLFGKEEVPKEESKAEEKKEGAT
ncbi:MAG: 30S ribosomal protein S6e [Nanoarchaeota archaeon]|nr:30S ribosomal protein S6e [Nanoarchaeota archaeon]MBU1445177.1 30S ribosomal protein S6e [Nanoarchaeota archaeon]MBU2406765.1 30S ribosomal protein S6e [Nanoarchaeota archaeon]MBU2420872.1 30S ribosomal protein S6e [Nanoarchaeota archaeon]MBU2475343.1 30S ribosomal protein S6e [Nanoarchaeota archaeon]